MGRPVTHWQIVTTDPDKLTKFYCDMFGWTANADNPLNYRMIDTGSDHGINGGIWPAPPQAPSFVQLHVEVEDVAADIKRAESMGAKVIIAPQTLPEGQVMAVLQDPAGVPFVMHSQPRG